MTIQMLVTSLVASLVSDRNTDDTLGRQGVFGRGKIWTGRPFISKI